MNWFKKNKKAASLCDQAIQLNDIEKAIMNIVRNTCEYIKKKNAIIVEARICGGWVRDQLLGVESDDIDISLSNMTGADFVKYIQEYTSKNGQEDFIGRTYIVDQNIEKSKHLATAGINLFGQKVEFVNLRSETYGDSRVPEMTIGTPQQDAQRRDLTINALFYNITTGQIEDYVGGCDDLETMILKTPLDPEKTFQDDPLRMLRVLRFYSRYPNAKIDSSVIEAMKNPNVQNEYNKLAPERAAPEIFKTMKGAKPAEAIRILFETGLYKQVFQLPDDFMPIDTDQKSHWHQYTLMNHILSVLEKTNKLSNENNYDDDKRAAMNLSAMFHDFGKMSPTIRTPHPKRPGYFRYIGHENESSKLANEIMTRMGFNPKIKDFVVTLTQAHMTPHQLDMLKNSPKTRKNIGKFINRTKDLSDEVLVLGLADALSKGDLQEDEIASITQERQQQRDALKQYQTQYGQNLSKPLLDGNEVKNIVRAVAPELEENNAFLQFRNQHSPKHHLALLLNRLLEKQWSGEIADKTQATSFMQGLAKQFLHLWKDQNSLN